MAEHRAQRDLGERRTVAGLFADQASAEQAIHALKAAGFTGDQIGVAMRGRTAQGVLMEEAQAAEGATAGALGGGLLGGLTGFLIGIGALAIPGFGPVVAGGVLASAFGIAGGTALAGAGRGGSGTGSAPLGGRLPGGARARHRGGRGARARSHGHPRPARGGYWAGHRAWRDYALTPTCGRAAGQDISAPRCFSRTRFLTARGAAVARWWSVPRVRRWA
jgi:hypothetical protein